MKRTFMIGVAAGALLAGVNIAASQGTTQPPAASGSGGASMEQKSGGGADQRGAQQQQKGSGGAQMKSDSPATSGQAPQGQRAQDTQKQGDQQKPQGAQKQDTKQDAQKQDTKQDAQKQDTKQDAQKQDAQKSGSGQAAGSDKAGGGSKTLSAEQKTKIRQTVISSGPRVTNVNFSVSVGTVIPRTVTLAALPPILVEIYPEWRSYRYVIVEERIIIVEPSSFKIIAVLVV